MRGKKMKVLGFFAYSLCVLFFHKVYTCGVITVAPSSVLFCRHFVVPGKQLCILFALNAPGVLFFIRAYLSVISHGS